MENKYLRLPFIFASVNFPRSINLSSFYDSRTEIVNNENNTAV